MLHLTANMVGLRQILATGRLSERVTGRSLAANSATLSAKQGAGPVLGIAARFAARGEGYFAFNVIPMRDVPALSGGGAVTLRAEFKVDGRPVLVTEATVSLADLALEDASRTIDGQTVVLKRVKGAPFDLSAQIDPPAAALQGIVLHANDPAQPVAGVTVEAGPASTVTDNDGRFFLTPLPLQAVVTLKLTKNASTASESFQIDYDRPVNIVTLSLPA
jgi:hypothetical protein